MNNDNNNSNRISHLPGRITPNHSFQRRGTLREEGRRAASCLKNGGVIICPSESCYSFSCDARCEEAVSRIHKIKGDAEFKPITIMVSDLGQVEEFGILNDKTKELAEKFMPGQINLIIDKKDPEKYNFLSRAEDGIAFRIPNCEITLEIIRRFGSPITTTSVNLHGHPGIYKIAEARKLFQDKVCAIVNAGDLNEKIPVSTIYDTRTGKVIREGLVKIK